MIVKKNEFREERRCVGGGIHELEFHHKFTQEELFGKCRLCSEIILQPGQAVGLHKHEVEAEIYYMLEGELVSVSADGGEEAFVAGDMMVTGGGASHSVRNDSALPAKLLAVIIN